MKLSSLHIKRIENTIWLALSAFGMMNPIGLQYINVEDLFLGPWELQRLLFLEELLLNRPAKATITLSQASTSRSPGFWSSSIGAIAHPCSRNSTHVEMREAPSQSFASSDPAQMTAVYINIYTSRSKAPFTLRQMFLIQLLISIRYLYLSTMRFGVAPRTDTKKGHVLKRDWIGCSKHNNQSRLSSQHNLGGGVGGPIWPFYELQNYEESDYSLHLDLLTISY